MSAIGALWRFAGNASLISQQNAMLSALAMYGPESQSCWSDDRIALVVNRSSCLPEDRFENQPLWADDRSACLVADLRLDNRADLARELGLIHPEELADSAILMAAWLRWGSACVDHLLGAFAFAVWTPALQKLFAARDHSGERPLFYHGTRDWFALASMPQGLLALPGTFRGFEESRLVQWLAGLEYDRTKTFFAGIERVPPGHLLRVTPDRVECRQYWHPANAKPTRFKRDEDYAEALVEILDGATEARLRSTGAIGSFLSGGLDSTSVTASAALLLANRGKGLTAFTSVPRPAFNGSAVPGRFANEGGRAAEVARLYPNVEHHIVDSRGYDLLPTMKTWSDAWDQPLPNLANQLWLTAIFDLARQRGIGVMLAGDMGGCTMSWNSWSILGQMFRHGQWTRLAKTVKSLHNHGAISYKTAARFATQGLVPAGLVRTWIARRQREERYVPPISPGWMARFGVQMKVYEASHEAVSNPAEEHNRLFEYADPGSVQKAILAVTGIEVRDPTVDKRIYEYCFSIPPEQFLAEGLSRSLIRRAMKGRLPDSVRLEHARGQQSADWYISLREALPSMREELAFIEKSSTARELLDLPRLHRLLDTFPESGFDQPRVFHEWNAALAYAISLGYFLRSNEAAWSKADSQQISQSATPIH